ncbi:MAG: fatty acid-binding protein DegV [Tenericutes bacterium HGW-Tenericutes-4]|jgi:DegV family protein with EDD domain|nr:MAG: fatty acid-binding protein DegV [Tenericutes bacterium HGW-Tenericutes-4]
MKKIIISSDSCLDELKSVLREKNIEFVPMVYILDKEYKDNFDSQDDYDNFYVQMRNGAMPTTSMLNIFEAETYFRRIVKEYDCDIVHISLSSGLSGTYENTLLASENVMEKFPDNKIYVVDSLSATQGQNLLVNYALRQKEKGKTAQGIFNDLQEVKYNLQHWVYISDLFHLRRGGRVTAAKAVIGSMLKTKPILSMSSTGKLDMKEVAMGGKKAIKTLFGKLEKYGYEDKENNSIYLAHSHNLEEANELKKLILKHYKNAVVEIKNIGPLIGAHTGPGALGLLFFGKERV